MEWASGFLKVAHQRSNARAWLKQALANLVMNALRHGQPADGDLQITVGCRSVGAEVSLLIADNGPGIATVYHKKIFGLFQRLNPDAEGTGIGLAIVKRVAEVHGGRASVEETPGGGATFVLTLPMATHIGFERRAG